MDKKKNLIVINLLISILTFIAFIWMFVGVSDASFAAIGLESLKYFTVLSNLFVGLVSTISIFFYLGKRKLPKILEVLKLSATTSVTLTFLVTLFYLVPLLGGNALSLYMNNNFLFHLLIPILSFISFAIDDSMSLKKREYLLALIPIIIYMIYYVSNVYIHEGTSNITYNYDFYGFTKGKLVNALYVIPIIFVVIVLIEKILIKLNKYITKGN